MAIDTNNKRLTATLFLVPSYARGMFPDGTINQGDRQGMAWYYSGILAGAPPTPSIGICYSLQENPRMEVIF